MNEWVKIILSESLSLKNISSNIHFKIHFKMHYYSLRGDFFEILGILAKIIQSILVHFLYSGSINSTEI